MCCYVQISQFTTQHLILLVGWKSTEIRPFNVTWRVSCLCPFQHAIYNSFLF